MIDWLVIFAVIVLPFVGIGLIRLLRRDEPRKETHTGKEVTKGASEGIVASLISWIWK